MAQRTKVPAIKSEDLSSIPTTQMVENELTLEGVL